MDSRGRGAVKEGQLCCGGAVEHIRTGSFISFGQHNSVIGLRCVTCDVLVTLRPAPLAAFIALLWYCVMERPRNCRWGRDSFQLCTGSLGTKLQGLLAREAGHGKDRGKADTEVPSEESRKRASVYTLRELRVSVRLKQKQKQVSTEDPQKLRDK